MSSNKNKKRIRASDIAIAVMVIAILFCIGYEARAFMQYKESDRVYKELKLSVESNPVLGNEEVKDGADKDYIQVDLAKARLVNSDIALWLYIPDTNVDYPVVYTNDNNKYLDTLVDGTAGVSGTLFIDERIHDLEHNIIIYGHNMKDGTMFHDLRNYTYSNWKYEHEDAYINTGDIVKDTYKVVGCIRVRYDDDLYQNAIDNDNLRVAKKFLENDELTSIDYNKNVVLLSTCDGNGDYRLVVALQKV